MLTELTEPVAVVGAGCRFPGGADSPDAYWRLLADGVNTTGPVPDERWEQYRAYGPRFEAALRAAVREGGFLSDVGRFDAEFFGISPREAALMDPQQRLLLEVGWEALEHAGIPPHTLAGTDTGVFVGVCTGDYGAQILEDLPAIEAWTGIGAATCALANRISHVLDLRGPSLSVDTACSASLVAIHLACQSLRLGESALALAGGVNLLVSPGQTLTLGAAGALAPDGRSKAFDAAADGYGRGEGCGVLALKLLSRAQRDGDRVLAVIRGSAVNQDGRTNGIMAPCGRAQEHVMARACANAGVPPSSVGYIEAHGTGTLLGDPMEAAALAAVYGRDRDPAEPCLVGSVKANIGHLEGAAGVAGAIKAVLALDRAHIPANLLSTAPNPAIAWEESGLRLVTEPMPWPDRGRPRRAGVSGFGYGGTVAHVVLEQAPAQPDVSEPAQGGGAYTLVPLSAETEPALRANAAALADWVEEQEPPLGSLAHTLALRRSPLRHRAVVAAADRADLTATLRRLAAGEADRGLPTGTRARARGAGLVWVFSGHGSQWPGMGRDLLGEPPFAEVIDRLEPILQAEIGFSPRQVLTDGALTGVHRIQTMIFVMQAGLAALWRSCGVEPDAVIGHSVGEIAAAVVGGALSLEDGARLICRRSTLLRRVAGKGAMVMVTLPFVEAAERLAGRDGLVAAIASSPASTVVAGDPEAVARLAGEWPGEGIGVIRVASDVAFHSPHMDPLLDDLAAAAADLSPGPYRVRVYSTALTDPRQAPAADGAYWAANLRNPVRLADAVTAAVEDGFTEFLEISPHPVVTHSINETLAELDVEEPFAGVTLRRNRPEVRGFVTALGALHCRGVELDWARLVPAGELLTPPPYQWQGHRLWYRPSGAFDQGRGHEIAAHTLIGAPITVAGSPLRLWRTSLDDGNRPYPGSHSLNGVEIVPAAVLVETFRAAAGNDQADEADQADLADLADVEMRHPLFTADRVEVQVVHEGDTARLASRTPAEDPRSEPPWLVLAEAKIAPAAPLPGRLDDPADHRLLPADPGLIHQRLAEVGVPTTGFEWTVDRLHYGPGRLQAQIALPEPGTWAPILDAVLSVAPAGFPGAPMLRMVVHIDDVVTRGTPPDRAIIEIVRDEGRDDTVHALIAGPDGRVIGRLGGLRYPVIEAPAAAEETAAQAAAQAAAADLTSYAGLSPEELRERVLAEVTDQIATEMRLPVTAVNPRRPLVEQGLDSVLTVVIRRRLEQRFGHRLPATIFWRQPTVTAIADHLAELLTGEA